MSTEYQLSYMASEIDEKLGKIDELISASRTSVTKYGAKGDGSTDDTVAFQTALATCRTLFVPSGTYVLSGTLIIAENCELELSQDTILQFVQTSGNCIEMRGSATLRGNHGIISVPYAFTGNAISCDTALDGEPHNSIPPYVKADPMFKRQRFVYDVNIIKPNSAGFYRTDDGVCNGTAIYMSADGTASIPWMWAITMGGVRIAGGFSYGIRAVNFDDPDDYEDNAWNHDMRIEAVIEACEVGVSLENCNGAHLAVTIQPCIATSNSAAYAKWGVYLNDSRFVDMMGSRIWDWNANNSLWTEGGQHQHLALIGNCRGLILDDFLYYESGYDIRDLIYTDTASNLEQMTILQEPFTRWFKSVDNAPYFYDGVSNKALMLKTEKFTTEQMEFIHEADGYYTYTPNFTNLVSGYEDDCYLVDNGVSNLSGYTTTDYIPIDSNTPIHVYRIGGDGISWDDQEYCRIAWFDADKQQKGSVMARKWIDSSIYYPTSVDDELVAFAFSTSENNAGANGAAYFRITAKGKGANLVVTIDEPLDYTAVWHGEPKRLDESVYAQNLFLTSPSGNTFKIIVNDDGMLSTESLV